MMDGTKFDDAQTGEQKIRNFNINFGPQHPAAHGVLRLVLELDGELRGTLPARYEVLPGALRFLVAPA